MNYYVYILTNPSYTVLYTGVTKNLAKRVYEHKNHLVPQSFTAKYNAVNLVYYECTTDIKIAIEREKQIKRWSRKKKDFLIDTMNPERKDLYLQILE
ncbi:MAG: GIY-YIG nuclease family protein [Clostridia bacterium]|nr:GIY-YIG nuclease family protein [Clostridia bacterium]